MLWFPRPEGELAPVHPITFHRVMELLPARAWQLAQEADGLKVLLSGARDAFSDETLVNALRQSLRDHGVVISTIEVQHVEAIPRGAAGKAPLIVANSARRRMEIGK